MSSTSEQFWHKKRIKSSYLDTFKLDSSKKDLDDDDVSKIREGLFESEIFHI